MFWFLLLDLIPWIGHIALQTFTEMTFAKMTIQNVETSAKWTLWFSNYQTLETSEETIVCHVLILQLYVCPTHSTLPTRKKSFLLMKTNTKNQNRFELSKYNSFILPCKSQWGQNKHHEYEKKKRFDHNYIVFGSSEREKNPLNNQLSSKFVLRNVNRAHADTMIN